jgi:hypothetical protein
VLFLDRRSRELESKLDRLELGRIHWPPANVNRIPMELRARHSNEDHGKNK